MKDNDIEIKNLNVMIVGGAGFIGHNIAIHLNKLGAKVSIIDSFQVNNLISIVGNQDNIPFPELSQLIINERIKILNENKIQMRVWERGAGITLACGSGACAAVYAGMKKNLLSNNVEVILAKGSLHILIQNDVAIMTGPAEISFKGTILI